MVKCVLRLLYGKDIRFNRRFLSFLLFRLIDEFPIGIQMIEFRLLALPSNIGYQISGADQIAIDWETVSKPPKLTEDTATHHNISLANVSFSVLFGEGSLLFLERRRPRRHINTTSRPCLSRTTTIENLARSVRVFVIAKASRAIQPASSAARGQN